MTQYNLFGETPPIATLPKTTTVTKGQWYNIDGYKDPGLVSQVMDKWVELDSDVSPCWYARIKDLTPKQ